MEVTSLITSKTGGSELMFCNRYRLAGRVTQNMGSVKKYKKGCLMVERLGKVYLRWKLANRRSYPIIISPW